MIRERHAKYGVATSRRFYGVLKRGRVPAPPSVRDKANIFFCRAAGLSYASREVAKTNDSIPDNRFHRNFYSFTGKIDIAERKREISGPVTGYDRGIA